MSQVVTLTGYEEKKRGRNDRGEWALRLFTAAGGTKFQTFDVGLGDRAIALLNQPVEIDYDVKDNGDFKNNVIKSIRQTNGSAPAEAASSGAPVNAPVEDPRRSKEEMRRTEAAIVAASLLPGFPEEQRNIETLAAIADKVILYFEAGSSAFTPDDGPRF